MSREAVAGSVAAVANKATYTGAGTSVLAWLVSSEFGVLFGICLGLAGLLVTTYFKRREIALAKQREAREAAASEARQAREAAEHEAKMLLLRQQLEAVGESA